MAFKITVHEITPVNSSPSAVEETTRLIYEQRVPTIDMQRIFDAVNHRPRIRRNRTEVPATVPTRCAGNGS